MKTENRPDITSNPERESISIAVRFIQKDYGYGENRASKMAEQLFAYGDIFEEFLNYICSKQLCKADGTKLEVQGYTAEELCRGFNLSPLGAYNYLVYLKEEPEKALEDLKRGLPRK